jgi:hypothetical protein
MTLFIKKEKGCEIQVSKYELDEGDNPRHFDNIGTIVNAGLWKGFGDIHRNEEYMYSLSIDDNNIWLAIYKVGDDYTTEDVDTDEMCKSIIYCTKESAQKKYPDVSMEEAIELAIKDMEKKVFAYNKFLQGEVYKYAIFYPNGRSCSDYGFYSPNEAFSEASLVIEKTLAILGKPCSPQVQINTGMGLVKI